MECGVGAIEGTGRSTAYASGIDMLTNDPTYVPRAVNLLQRESATLPTFPPSCVIQY